jgi:DNA primase
LCPFHHEKSPSFFVNDNLGYYKCFGCGEHGDIFDFIQKYDNLDFKEALEYLANRAGITLQKRQFDPQEQLRQRLLEIHQIATEYYEHNLLNHQQAAPIRDYLDNRGLTAATRRVFHLGAALDDWQSLADHLRSHQFTPQEMTASGLVIEGKTGRLFDRFRARLMFPLKNHRGQVVGFSGRIIKNNPREAKYLNTPETPLYHKGKMLYGLFELSQEIKKAKALIVVEGEFDMLSSLQAKVSNVVAIKGSAFTIDQAKLISRYVKKVILALDSDPAGVAATKKAITTLRTEGIELEVLMLNSGKDPDELAHSNPAAWRKQVKTTISVYDFFLHVILNHYNLKKITDQKKILQELAPIFALIDNRLEYEHYLKKLALALNQDSEIIRTDLQKWHELHQENSPLSPQPKAPAPPLKNLTNLERLEAYLWFLFLHCLSDNVAINSASAYISKASWKNNFLTQLTAYYQAYFSTTPTPTLKGFHHTLPQDFKEKVSLLGLNQNFMKYLVKTDLLTEWTKTCHEHQLLSRQHQIATLTTKLKQFTNLDDLTDAQEQARQDLLHQITTLTKSKTNPN